MLLKCFKLGHAEATRMIPSVEGIAGGDGLGWDGSEAAAGRSVPFRGGGGWLSGLGCASGVDRHMRSDVRDTEQANCRHRAMCWPRGRGQGEI